MALNESVSTVIAHAFRFNFQFCLIMIWRCQCNFPLASAGIAPKQIDMSFQTRLWFLWCRSVGRSVDRSVGGASTCWHFVGDFDTHLATRFPARTPILWLGRKSPIHPYKLSFLMLLRLTCLFYKDSYECQCTLTSYALLDFHSFNSSMFRRLSQSQKKTKKKKQNKQKQKPKKNQNEKPTINQTEIHHVPELFAVSETRMLQTCNMTQWKIRKTNMPIIIVVHFLCCILKMNSTIQ